VPQRRPSSRSTAAATFVVKSFPQEGNFFIGLTLFHGYGLEAEFFCARNF
jgi:hypothetical protein